MASSRKRPRPKSGSRKKRSRRDPSWYGEPRRHAKASRLGWDRRKHTRRRSDPKRARKAPRKATRTPSRSRRADPRPGRKRGARSRRRR